MKNIVAIVGRPNVGKSSLFNKLSGKRVAIVYDEPGVTRDRIYAKIAWNKWEFEIIDTGGIQVENSTFQEQIQTQAKIAIEEATVIVFVIDGRYGLTHDDELILNILRKSQKPVVVAVNKLEGNKDFDSSIWTVGFDLFKISALHGDGVGDLLDSVISFLKPNVNAIDQHLKLTILGRPNSGKSSLLNALLQTERSIVSPIANTTRDSIKSNLKINDVDFEIIDTAGINRKSRLVESVDHYALVRARNSLEEANIVLLMMDGTLTLSHFDARIIGYSAELFKPIILVVNKWDIIEKSTNTMMEMERNIRKEFKFVSWAPIVFISALKKTNLQKLKDAIVLVKNNMEKRLKTSLINELLIEIQAIQPAPSYKGGRLNISFGQQIHGAIPTFVLTVNNRKFLHFTYERFVENKIREYFGFEGTPIKLLFRDKKE